MRVCKLNSPEGMANAYFISAEGPDGVIIDPSSEDMAQRLASLGLVCRYVLLTHGHFDHTGGCRALQAAGAKILCGGAEKDFIFSRENLGIFGGVYIPPFKVDGTIKDGDTLSLCGIDFTALHTPGHTKGSMCYLAQNCLFTGDTLFDMSIGRTDLPGGDMAELMGSLNKLRALPGSLTIYPGHGGESTLKRQFQYNPFF